MADPYRDMAEGLEYAFDIGRSRAVGGTTTDIVAIAGDRVFAQIRIGADDELPRRMRPSISMIRLASGTRSARMRRTIRQPW